MTRNVTFRIRESLLHKARTTATGEKKSLNSWIEELLERTLVQDQRFQIARQRAITRLAQGMKLGGSPISRDRLYER